MGDRVAQGKRNTLVVGISDEPTAHWACEAFASEDREVIWTPRPEELLDSLERTRPDLVLLAFDEMEADGFSTCRELRARAQGDPFRILVAADPQEARTIASAYEAGADDFVPRPINWELLRHRVRNLLRSSRLVSELRMSQTSFENAQRIARVGSWELLVDTREMWWSEQTHRLLGLTPGDAKTNLESFSLCIHPEDRDGVVQTLTEALETHRPFDITSRVVLPSGAIRHVQLRGEAFPDATSDRPGVQGTLQDVTEQRRAQEKIRHLAHFDSLTGLSSRLRFREQLEKAIDQARKNGNPMGLLYMDLDQFKRINDTLGHTAGDHLLQRVADVLSDNVRNTDVVGRYVGDERDIEISRVGGDEFAVVLTNISSLDDAGHVAQRILSAITQPIFLEEQQLSTTASIGIAVYPFDGQDAETLVKHADTAMYKAKERGRNNFQFFAHSMNAGTLRRLTLETHLRNALDRGELSIRYQPRVDLHMLRISGLEALLRWTHPEFGSISPREFIPVAEETGLIVPIGEWVLQTACSQAKEWEKAGFDSVCMSVNVSTRQFIHDDLRAVVERALRSSGLNPGKLELEITESVVLQDDENTGQVLRDLKAMGVCIALDDFGTGYSSLSYLTRFPLDTLKLDRSLVREVASDPSAQGVATAVIAMAHALGLKATAEGVDEEGQARFLQARGCDELQGFLIAGAVSPDECTAFLDSPSWAWTGLHWDERATSTAPCEATPVDAQAPSTEGCSWRRA